MMELNEKDLHIRLTDQRIGMGIGGWDTVLTVYHEPTRIRVELPSVQGQSDYKRRKLAVEMIEYALSSGFWD